MLCDDLMTEDEQVLHRIQVLTALSELGQDRRKEREDLQIKVQVKRVKGQQNKSQCFTSVSKQTTILCDNCLVPSNRKRFDMVSADRKS